MQAELMAFAPPEERTMRARRIVIGRHVAIIGIAGYDTHRSV
jgi:hypothetical protein